MGGGAAVRQHPSHPGLTAADDTLTLYLRRADGTLAHASAPVRA